MTRRSQKLIGGGESLRFCPQHTGQRKPVLRSHAWATGSARYALSAMSASLWHNTTKTYSSTAVSSAARLSYDAESSRTFSLARW
jgi:hypothetical protein